MRIAVMGAGSVGGFLGGMLARGGHDVSLIVRGAHLEAIRERGLRVVRDHEEFTVPCAATDNPAEVGAVELALLTTKTYQNSVAVPAMGAPGRPGDHRAVPAERRRQLRWLSGPIRTGKSARRVRLH